MTRDEDIQALQERIIFLEQTLEQINSVVVDLNRRVGLVDGRIRKLHDAVQRVETRAEQQDKADTAEIPPHYGLPRSVAPEQLRHRRDENA
ncbi:MAG: SlyX family protein [Phycisphaerae bacterium]